MKVAQEKWYPFFRFCANSEKHQVQSFFFTNMRKAVTSIPIGMNRNEIVPLSYAFGMKHKVRFTIKATKKILFLSLYLMETGREI